MPALALSAVVPLLVAEGEQTSRTNKSFAYIPSSSFACADLSCTCHRTPGSSRLLIRYSNSTVPALGSTNARGETWRAKPSKATATVCSTAQEAASVFTGMVSFFREETRRLPCGMRCDRCLQCSHIRLRTCVRLFVSRVRILRLWSFLKLYQTIAWSGWTWLKPAKPSKHA